jgi:hypothetical protein
MSRPQFTLRTLLWLMVVVAAFCAGFELARQRGEAARVKVLDELLTTLHVLDDTRQVNSDLRDENKNLSGMLKIGKRGQKLPAPFHLPASQARNPFLPKK